MAEIVEVVETIEKRGPGFECQMCDTVWIPQDPEALTNPEKRPRRCPKHGCRSVRWDRQKYPTARPPRPTDPTDGGGIALESGASDRSLPERITRRRTCYQTLPHFPLEKIPPSPVKNHPLGSPHDAIAA